MEKINVAIIGPGNIGSDLMVKIKRSKYLNLAMMVSRRESPGLLRAREAGIPASPNGAKAILDDPSIEIVFDCTSAAGHVANAPIIKEAGCVSIDLTPAALGPYLIPAVNASEIDVTKENELNMAYRSGINDINELAELCNDKISDLAEICNEGIGKMADLMFSNGDSYDTYSNWAQKLMDNYTDIAQEISA